MPDPGDPGTPPPPATGTSMSLRRTSGSLRGCVMVPLPSHFPGDNRREKLVKRTLFGLVAAVLVALALSVTPAVAGGGCHGSDVVSVCAGGSGGQGGGGGGSESFISTPGTEFAQGQVGSGGPGGGGGGHCSDKIGCVGSNPP